MPEHECIACERCGQPFECKAGTPGACQCQQINITLNEMQYISEQYADCLCLSCLKELKEEYYQELKR